MKITDSNTPLHLMDVKYPIPYKIPAKKQIIKKLNKVLNYLEKVTPSHLIDHDGNEVTNSSLINENTRFPESTFRLTSYEWGVTYSGLLKFGEVTGIHRFSEYTTKRLKMISDLSHFYFKNTIRLEAKSPLKSIINPIELDDCGAICFSMIQAQIINKDLELDILIENFISHISQKQYRLEDGTLARNRPYSNTLWLDDMFMSVPALALFGNSTKEKKYFDDAVHQVIKISERMFIDSKGLYFHGWVDEMETHPKFYWGRANGWAIMAMIELLSVLPKNHEGYSKVLNQFEKHLHGLISYQSSSGFWHQLIDKNDSYLETSATAIITYSIAKAINEGIIDSLAFSPIAILGWNAISTIINSKGQIKGTCVGTGMGFDPAFYYHRPMNKFAGHGYGPLFLAGSEIFKMLENTKYDLIEGSIQVVV